MRIAPGDPTRNAGAVILLDPKETAQVAGGARAPEPGGGIQVQLVDRRRRLAGRLQA